MNGGRRRKMANSAVNIVMIVFALMIGFYMTKSIGQFDRYCDYQFKESFEIESFQVSAGGFGQPTLVNIETTNNESKVIQLSQVYDSESDISKGDIIECLEAQNFKLYCSNKVKCERVKE